MILAICTKGEYALWAISDEIEGIKENHSVSFDDSFSLCVPNSRGRTIPMRITIIQLDPPLSSEEMAEIEHRLQVRIPDRFIFARCAENPGEAIFGLKIDPHGGVR